MTPSPKWDRTHTHIQLAALELFTHQGYSATTTAQIAAVAEVSQMTLFRHFPTKELRIVADNPELAAAAIHSNDETISAITTALTARGVDKLTATALATAVIAGLTRALIDWSTHINRPLMPTLRGVLHALAGTHA